MPRKFLLIVTFFAFAFSVASIFVDTDRETAKRDAYFQEQEEARATGGISFAGPYCFPDRHPQVLVWISILTGIAFLGSWFSKKALIPTLLSLATFSVFGYWCVDTQRGLAANESYVAEGFDLILYRANGYDVAALTLLSVEIIWQLSILSVSAINALKRKPTLP